MPTLHIRRGRIVDPSTGTDAVGDLFIADGTIVPSFATPADRTVDADGLVVCPGLIDLHVHLREPGFSHKETIETGTAAAAAGGFTTVVAMPNTNPCADNAEVIRQVMDRAVQLAGTRVVQAGAITVGRRGLELADLAQMARDTGVRLFTDDGDGVADDALMQRAFEISAANGLLLCQHAEVAQISKKAAIHKGDVSTALKISGQPIEAEEDMVLRDIALVRKTGGRLHVSHISSARAIDAVRAAKREGLPVTAEVTPHHLHLTDAAVQEAGTIAKVAPPLRPWPHVEACRAALADGTIDAVATDHAPHTLDDKSGSIETAAFGMVGLEIAVPMLLALVDEGLLTISRMVDAMSCAPARISGLPGGTLAPGSVADVTIINPSAPFEIDPRTFRSKGINTPFAGTIAPGRAVCTIVGGAVVFDALPARAR